MLIAATADDTYVRGKELFEQTYFEQSAPLLKAFLEDPGDASAARVTRARAMLAQALFFTGDRAGATREVKALLKRGDIPGEKDWPPDFADFVGAIRAKEPRLKPRPTAPREPPTTIIITQPASQPLSPASAPQQVKVEPVVVDVPPWYVRGIPFGIGHFVANEHIGGGVFIGLSALLLAGNIALTVINANNRLPSGEYPNTVAYPTLYALQHVSAGLFYATGVASIVDGIVFVPGRIGARF